MTLLSGYHGKYCNLPVWYLKKIPKEYFTVRAEVIDWLVSFLGPDKFNLSINIFPSLLSASHPSHPRDNFQIVISEVEAEETAVFHAGHQLLLHLIVKFLIFFLPLPVIKYLGLNCI